MQLNNLGAKIIFASTNKLIIDTGKPTKAGAETFVNFILKSIISYPLFTYISSSIECVWQFIMFYDEYNYGGVKETTGDSEDQNAETTCITNWKMAEILPFKLEEQFVYMISQY